ncbi:unnamed protein product [Orchesella dallaii]|uniref:Tenascin-X n=1 Tax=Orchesella dallaii TaxID=48710 RepID=A0ABP1Q0X3_9HEXA
MNAFKLLCYILWIFTMNLAYAYMDMYLLKGYKESCSNDSNPCNSVKFLSCLEGQCVCAAPDEMIYDHHRNQCAALASYSCLRPMPDSNSVQDPKYQMQCVENAKCLFPGDVCQCQFRYYEADNHTCIQQHSYGAECSIDEHCDQFKFFSCLNGKCSCDPNKNHHYDMKNDKCLVPVGEKCRVIEFTSISEKHFKTDECAEHANCDTGRCKCNPGYRISKDKTCGRELGDTCDSQNKKCADIQFTCRNKACDCKYPLHQISDLNTSSCISLVAGPCTTDREAKHVVDPHFIQNCTENAFCQESQAFSYCKCKEGYVETNDGLCVKAYGQSCETDDECDSLAPLACIENKCDCADSLQVFDDKLRRCVGLAGSRCWKDANSTSAVCTSNAYCVKANSHLNYGKCICVRGFVTTSQKTCAKSN